MGMACSSFRLGRGLCWDPLFLAVSLNTMFLWWILRNPLSLTGRKPEAAAPPPLFRIHRGCSWTLLSPGLWLITRGFSNHFCDTFVGIPLMKKLVFRVRAFLLYHRSGFHSPQPWAEPFLRSHCGWLRNPLPFLAPLLKPQLGATTFLWHLQEVRIIPGFLQRCERISWNPQLTGTPSSMS